MHAAFHQPDTTRSLSPSLTLEAAPVFVPGASATAAALTLNLFEILPLSFVHLDRPGWHLERLCMAGNAMMIIISHAGKTSCIRSAP